jgi:hypothetical protein
VAGDTFGFHLVPTYNLIDATYNGQYARVGDSGYSPGLIDSMDFDTLRSQLTGGSQSDATTAIKAEADLITAYICLSTGGQPASACKT